jgi:hypothetical protein
METTAMPVKERSKKWREGEGARVREAKKGSKRARGMKIEQSGRQIDQGAFC